MSTKLHLRRKYRVSNIEYRISSIEPNSGIDKYRRNQVSNQHYLRHVLTDNIMDFKFRIILHVPCLGPLAPRGAVGARHDGLPRQFSPLLPVVCHGLSLSEGFAGPLRDVITPALFRHAPSSTAFDCTLYYILHVWFLDFYFILYTYLYCTVHWSGFQEFALYKIRYYYCRKR